MSKDAESATDTELQPSAKPAEPTDHDTANEPSEASAADPAASISESAEEVEEASSYREHPMVPVRLLVTHPDNVREDATASTAFCASVAAMGVIDPLEITTDPSTGLLRVVDGNVRLDAAVKVGLEEVPYFFSPATDADEARQFLHMLVTSRFKTGLTQAEEAAALFHASRTMTRRQIREATGLRAANVRAGIKVGGMNPETIEAAQRIDYSWTLEDLALLAPFENDPDAMRKITREVEWGRPLRYVVQSLLDDRAEASRRRKLITQLEADGYTVAQQRPDNAVLLRDLRQADGEPLTIEDHASCPGRGAYLLAWSTDPHHYCTDPVGNGHMFAATGTTQPPPVPETYTRPVSKEHNQPSTDRKVVIEGNRAWQTAATVRQEWLAAFLTRKTVPKDVAGTISRFVTTQLLTMPEPLRRALGSARHSNLFHSFGHPDADSAAKSSLPGLWMLALAPIATAYEREMTGDGDHRHTWRHDMYSPCSFENASDWLAFLTQIGAQHGWEPSPIEQAVAAGEKYQGDQPTEDLTDEPNITVPEGCDSVTGITVSAAPTDNVAEIEADAPGRTATDEPNADADADADVDGRAQDDDLSQAA